MVAELAARMGAEDFAFSDVGMVTETIGTADAQLVAGRSNPPPPALDVWRRRTHFRGHRLEDKARGLAGLPTGEPDTEPPVGG